MAHSPEFRELAGFAEGAGPRQRGAGRDPALPGQRERPAPPSAVGGRPRQVWTDSRGRPAVANVVGAAAGVWRGGQEARRLPSHRSLRRPERIEEMAPEAITELLACLVGQLPPKPLSRGPSLPYPREAGPEFDSLSLKMASRPLCDKALSSWLCPFPTSCSWARGGDARGLLLHSMKLGPFCGAA